LARRQNMNPLATIFQPAARTWEIKIRVRVKVYRKDRVMVDKSALFLPFLGLMLGLIYIRAF
jgi:hypothetical protein